MRDDWRLCTATRDDMDELMSWFPDANAVKLWGGPRFRYPYTRKTFLRDCHWGKMASFGLRDPGDSLTGFGQLYERIGRINLARLVVREDSRGQGAGKRLIELLMIAGPTLFRCREFSLFVYRNNLPALNCYKSVGFSVSEYPPKAPMADECYYLTRPVDSHPQ